MRPAIAMALTLVAAVLALALPALAQAPAPQWTLKLATVAPDGTPWADGLKRFKAQVEADTGGRLQVRPFTGGILGDENESVAACKSGQVQGVGASTGALASIVPELAVLELPYLFRNEDEADYILDKVVQTTLEKHFRDRGLVLGFWSENGYRSYGTTFGFIKTPADLQGHKMRAQEAKVHLETYRAFGAQPVPIPVTEVLTSLQTGVVEGFDNTPLFAQAAQWTGATKYWSVTRHIYQPAAIVFNRAWYDGLPADVQAALLKARAGLAVEMRAEIRALDGMLVENFTSMKIQVHKNSAAELAAFEAPAKKARDAYLASASAGEKALYKMITDGLAAYRSGKR